MGNKAIALYMNNIMKCTTNEQLHQLMLEASNDDNVNRAEDMDFLLVATRYRRVKLGILEYVPLSIGRGIALSEGL